MASPPRRAGIEVIFDLDVRPDQQVSFPDTRVAIVVTRHGCANFMGTLDEVMAFAEERGGLDWG